MIIDTTQTKMEQELALANVMEQLKQIANEPNLTINCHCGKICCLEDHNDKIVDGRFERTVFGFYPKPQGER